MFLLGDEDILYCSVHLHEPGFYPYPNGARVEDNVHNFPLKRGLCDETFISLFDSRVLPLLEGHRPDVVVAQLGADGAFGDPVGQHWNLTERAFAHVSMRLRESSAIGRVLLLGGGGYHHANTASCWAHATAAALGTTCPGEKRMSKKEREKREERNHCLFLISFDGMVCKC